VARELAKKNVTVNCIAPGFIITEMTGKLPDIVKDAAKQVIPMRKFGKVDDIAKAIGFLTSDDTSYITGQVLCVDGGMAM
jgi:3-oxoacyl-[acyl-carrier protein] reductase